MSERQTKAENQENFQNYQKFHTLIHSMSLVFKNGNLSISANLGMVLHAFIGASLFGRQKLSNTPRTQN